METPGDGEVRTPALGGILTAATYLLELIIVAASYFGLAAANLLAPSINPAMTPLWPPTGIALALVLLRGNQIWPAILLGSFAPYLIAGRSILEAGSIGIGTLLAAFSGALLISHWSNGPKTFAIPSGIAKFALISFAPTAMISSTIALAGFTLANAAAFADPVITWITWWLADTTGILIIVPVVLLWTMTPLRPFSKWSVLETVAVFAVVSAIGIVAYSPLIGSYLIGNDSNALLAHRSLVGSIVLLPLLWAGLRGNQRTVATAAIIFCATAMWGYSAGSNPFQKTDLNGALLSLFVLSMSVSVPPLILSAAIATRQNTEARLLSVQDQLNRQIKQTNLALDSANRHFQILIEGVIDYAIFVLDTAGHVGSWNSASISRRRWSI